MKKIFFLSILFFCYSCATVYQSPDASNLARDHKKIAILPSHVTIEARKKVETEAIEEMENDEAFNFQEAIYKWMLKRKTQGKIWVEIQEVNYTNTTLNKMGYFSGDPFTMKEIMDELDVDGLIDSSFSISKPMSEGAAIATAVLIGYFGATNKAEGSVSIFDSTVGKLIWRYDHKFSGGLGSTHDDCVNALLRKSSNRMPYIVRAY